MSLPPGRDQILLLVGSYEEAAAVADTLHNLNPRWRDRVLRLVSDDQEIDEDAEAPSSHRARVLRRGDVEHLKDLNADVLVAPLLAVERGHNILNDDAVAAIGTVYFLARPNPHPDDLFLAVHAVNDWIVRAQQDGDFARWVASAETIEAGAEEVRRRARSRWYRLLRRSTAWSRLGDDREQITWDVLVLMWQVIGRLVAAGSWPGWSSSMPPSPPAGRPNPRSRTARRAACCTASSPSWTPTSRTGHDPRTNSSSPGPSTRRCEACSAAAWPDPCRMA